MEMIIARSGLSTGAVYGYFKGKDDIINAVVADGTAAMGRQLVPILKNPEPPPLPQFAGQLLRAIADFGRDKPGGIDRLLVSLHGRSHSQSDPGLKATTRTAYLPPTARAVRRDGPAVAGGRDVRPRRRPRRSSGAAAIGNPGIRRPAGTRQEYGYVAKNHIVPYVGHLRISEVNQETFFNLLVNVLPAEEASQTTIRATRKVLSAMCQMAFDEGYRDNNPIRSIRLKHAPTKPVLVANLQADGPRATGTH
jgi:AcrR family transcriptional regulator